MQPGVAILLFAMLAAVMAFFAVMGLKQSRRTKALARRAHEMGMQFSREDLFDVPRRYADMALMSSGHSPRANNVTHGRLAGLPVRAFDFRHELGHGPRRITRHYRVVAAESDRQLPPALIWHVEDEDFGPLTVRQPDGRIDCWRCLGDVGFARQLAEVSRPFADPGIGIETQGTRMLLWRRVEKGKQPGAVSIEQAAAAMREIEARAGRQG